MFIQQGNAHVKGKVFSGVGVVLTLTLGGGAGAYHNNELSEKAATMHEINVKEQKMINDWDAKRLQNKDFFENVYPKLKKKELEEFYFAKEVIENFHETNPFALRQYFPGYKEYIDSLEQYDTQVPDFYKFLNEMAALRMTERICEMVAEEDTSELRNKSILVPENIDLISKHCSFSEQEKLIITEVAEEKEKIS